jgi:hypothetical protein
LVFLKGLPVPDADQGNDLDVENLDVLKRQHHCLFFSYQGLVLSLLGSISFVFEHRNFIKVLRSEICSGRALSRL